jgi:hypothetical protein
MIYLLLHVMIYIVLQRVHTYIAMLNRLCENPLDIGTATTIASFAHALDCFAHAVLELMD